MKRTQDFENVGQYRSIRPYSQFNFVTSPTAVIAMDPPADRSIFGSNLRLIYYFHSPHRSPQTGKVPVMLLSNDIQHLCTYRKLQLIRQFVSILSGTTKPVVLQIVFTLFFLRAIFWLKAMPSIVKRLLRNPMAILMSTVGTLESWFFENNFL